MNEYFFIPGRLSNLSLSELISVLDLFTDHYDFNARSSNYFVVRTETSEEEMTEIFHRLGGFIKYGKIVVTPETLYERAAEGSNIDFGVSIYTFKEYKADLNIISTLQHDIKEKLSENGVKSRYIEGKDGVLTSAQVLNSKILEDGFELNIFENGEGEYQYGETLAVQALEQFSERDVDRPETDTEMGMLPPKLARIMVNLAQVEPGELLWDPFCGSGTVLVEGVLLGYDVLGSDIDHDAVSAARSNIEWVGENYPVAKRKFNIFHFDVKKPDYKVLKQLRNSGISAAVFEPYMGPPQRRMMSVQKAEKLLSEVEQLYKSVIDILEDVGTKGFRIVGVFPSYKTNRGWVTLRYKALLSNRWEILNKEKRNRDLHWSRSNSIIKRNLLLAELSR